MREDHVHAVNAEWIALLPLNARATSAFRWRLLVLTLALLEGLEIVEDVVANFFEILRHLLVRVFFLQLLDHPVHKHRCRFLLEITHLARQFARKRQCFSVDDRKFLPELIVFAFDVFGGHGLELSVLHQLRNLLNGNHLAFENRKDFRKSDGADLHAAKGKLIPRDAAREIVHQFLFTNGEALDDTRFLSLERLALEDLRYPAPEKFYPRLHFLFESVRLASRKREQARAVGILETVHVAAIGRKLARRIEFFDHPRDHAAAARPGKPADENVVARRRQFDAHLQGAKRALLSHFAGNERSLRGGLEGH